MLNSIDLNFYGRGVSSINDGVAILWRKSLGHRASFIEYGDSRIVGLCIANDKTQILILCMYMPTDCHENMDLFVQYLGKIHAIVEESEIMNVVVLGDWNASPDKSFGRELNLFCADNSMLLSDCILLPTDSYIYI